MKDVKSFLHPSLLILHPSEDILDGGNDVRIGATAAQIATHLLANVLVGASAPLAEQSDRGADLARRAVSALKGVVINKRLLHRMQRLAVGQTLDRRDLGAILHDGQRSLGFSGRSNEIANLADALA